MTMRSWPRSRRCRRASSAGAGGAGAEAQAAAGASSGRVIPPTSTPEPRWAPSTGPTSVQNSGSVPNISRPCSDQHLRVLRRLRVLDDPVARPAVVQLLQVREHPLHRPAVGAHAPHGSDLGAEREDRLDLQRGAHHRLCRPDAPAAAKVLERVQAEPDVERLACTANRLERQLEVGALRRRAGCEQHEAAEPPGSGLAVVNLDTARVAALGQQPRGLARTRARAREALGDVDRGHVAPGAHQRLVNRHEVAHRRLGGGWQLRRVAQARIEGIEVRVLALGPQVSLPADVQADLLDAPALEQLRREIRRAVGHDRHTRGTVAVLCPRVAHRSA